MNQYLLLFLCLCTFNISHCAEPRRSRPNTICSCNGERVPVDALDHSFGFLTDTELVNDCSLVCQEFEALTNHQFQVKYQRNILMISQLSDNFTQSIIDDGCQIISGLSSFRYKLNELLNNELINLLLSDIFNPRYFGGTQLFKEILFYFYYSHYAKKESQTLYRLEC